MTTLRLQTTITDSILLLWGCEERPAVLRSFHVSQREEAESVLQGLLDHVRREEQRLGL